MNESTRFGDLRGILHYVPKFRGRTFVVAIDGAVIASRNFANILLDLAVLQSLSIKVVIVHGAGQQIRELAEERGIAIRNEDGFGITDRATLGVAMDAVSRLTNQLMQQLTTTGLRGGTGNSVTARPAGIIDGVDQEFTGRVDRVDLEGLRAFLAEGILPVIPPLGYDGGGETLRVNSDEVALQVGLALKASKILFITNEAFPEEVGKRQLAEDEANALSKGGQLSRRLQSIVKTAARACAEGLERVQILDGRQEEVLLAELFSNEGVGTMVYSDEYRNIRPAQTSDVAEIMTLIQQSVGSGELTERSRADISGNLEDYAVLEVDGHIVGTVAVHYCPDEAAAEVACLFIKRDHMNQGHGRRLVGWAERRAQDLGATRLFALTTQATGFFEKVAGFVACDAEELPKERRDKRDASGRNSRVLAKELPAKTAT